MAELHLSILSENEKPEITIKDPNISTSKNQAPPPKTPSRTRERFTKEDMQFVLTWLEHLPNFTSVFGSGGQATVGKPIKTKASGYSALAGAVSEQSKGRLNVNGKNMRDRFRRHMKLYTSTKMGAQSICFFVTPQDNRRGIYTVAQKLEDLCTCYARMDVLFGHQPNVTPKATVDVGTTSAQKQNERQESSTALQHRRRLVVEEEEEEDESDNSSQDDGADLEEDSAREINGNDSDEKNAASISSPVVQWPQKHRLTDSESQASAKRSQATDQYKTPPTFEPSSSPELSRRPLLGSYEKSHSKRTTETRKLELETERLELETKRLELMATREAREM
ncbi:hypothetical protein BGZ74_003839 [Mortierella antarctica]|nr:hypothetical protein BGZ74_003839 [Mortierella antarctica]